MGMEEDVGKDGKEGTGRAVMVRGRTENPSLLIMWLVFLATSPSFDGLVAIQKSLR